MTPNWAIEFVVPTLLLFYATLMVAVAIWGRVVVPALIRGLHALQWHARGRVSERVQSKVALARRHMVAIRVGASVFAIAASLAAAAMLSR